MNFLITFDQQCGIRTAPVSTRQGPFEFSFVSLKGFN